MIETMHTFTQFWGNVWLAHNQLSIQERPALDLQIVSDCAKPSSVRILTSNTNHYIHYETAMEYCYGFGILLWNTAMAYCYGCTSSTSMYKFYKKEDMKFRTSLHQSSLA